MTSAMSIFRTAAFLAYSAMSNGGAQQKVTAVSGFGSGFAEPIGTPPVEAHAPDT